MSIGESNLERVELAWNISFDGYSSSMKSTEALRALADVTACQWGMVTTAQAAALGVSRLMLSRLAEAGHLERLAHGVYENAGFSR